jgi:hypothetical protein
MPNYKFCFIHNLFMFVYYAHSTPGYNCFFTPNLSFLVYCAQWTHCYKFFYSRAWWTLSTWFTWFFLWMCDSLFFWAHKTSLDCWGLRFLTFHTVRTPAWFAMRLINMDVTPSGSQEDPWRTPNSLKDPNVGPSRKQRKRDSGHAS